MKRLIHPSIQCRADAIDAKEYEMPDGTIVLAYSEADAREHWQANKDKPHPQDDDPTLLLP